MKPVERDPSQEPDSVNWGLAWRLAIGQIVSWGTLFYSFSVIVGPMQAATGWSRPFLNAGLSLGLLVWGLCTFPVGTWIRRNGGRALMTVASAAGGVALLLMSLMVQPALYLAVWIMLGIAMSGLLYEPAFAIVTAAFGLQFRKGITVITLVAGFASTVFIPMAQIAVEHFGWHRTLVSLGFLQIIICTPLHFFGLPKPPPAPVKPRTDTADLKKWLTEIRRDISDNRFLGVALWFPAHTAAFSGLTFLLIPFLQSRSVDTKTMLIAIALIGPMQVIGRLFLAAHVGQYSTTRIGAYALSALGLALVILLIFPPTTATLICFAILYGSGNGIMTILRGTVIRELFGPARYAELNGALAAPTMLAQALSPFILSAIWNASGRASSLVISAFALIVLAELGRRKTVRAINAPI